MAVEIKEFPENKVVEIDVSGKLRKKDFRELVPVFDRLMERLGKLRLVLVMHDFHGWTGGGLWEEIKFDWKHFSDIERLAMVGERPWQKGMSICCKPFTTAKVRYFPAAEREAARKWVREEVAR